MKPLNINDLNFENEVLKSPVPVLVDFWAPWCGPCQMMAPILEDLAIEFNGRVKIVKMNTDENSTAMRYNIMSIPTLVLFINGEVVDKIVGAVSKTQIAEKLNYFSQGAAVMN
jgi:thioredoxin 1